jgi:uncharacterized protein YyaL (SSP411 family)
MIDFLYKKRKNKVGINILLALTLLVFSCNPNKKSSAHSGNHLAQASSPYLLEHADNPVDWYEWSDEALAKAKKENKPLIISIGYAACHWCHVMEDETFMDTAVANYMNANFIAIKVDREQRPDLDEIYVNAAQLINGNAGWPLNAFALPDGKPFYAGTYFSKQDWLKLLQNIRESYTKDNAGVLAQSETLTKEIQQMQLSAGKADTSFRHDASLYQNIFDSLLTQVDFKYGGIKEAPKFPMPGSWEFMLQYAYLKKDKKALNAVTTLLDNLEKGGIYDHLGGGFCRYATDEKWQVPHFEKMLYDNAQLVSLYSHAFQYTGDPNFRNVIVETLAFIKRELTSPEGGFYSSLNADSEGKEGKFYVWKYEEISSILDKKELEAFEKVYAITKSGNWEEGENILFENNAVNGPDRVAPIVEKSRKKLLDVRNKRIRPSADDKILSSWNALMLKAYVDAYRALGDPAYLNEAVKNARFLEKNMVARDFTVKRSFRNGKVSIDAFLEDYAFLADAMLYLYQSTFDKHWLDMSKGLTDKANLLFFDAEAHFYTFNPAQNKNVLINSFAVNDGVIASGNAVMGLTQYRLGKMLYDEKYESRALKMLDLMKPKIAKNATYYTSWALLLGMEHAGTYEVAIIGNEAAPQSRLMQKNYLPNVVFAGGNDENLPLLEAKKVTNATRIYVCKEKVCKMPTSDVAAALKMIVFQ